MGQVLQQSGNKKTSLIETAYNYCYKIHILPFETKTAILSSHRGSEELHLPC